MKWVLLLVAILLEVCGTTCMKLSSGFSSLVPSLTMFLFYGGSLVVLNVALKQIPVGVAYAIWSALGMVLVSLIGVFYFKDPMSPLQMTFIVLILAGVIGLNVSGMYKVG